MKNIITIGIVILLSGMFLSYDNVTYPDIETYKGQTLEKKDIDDFLKKQMDSLGIPGISMAIINDGEIVYHKALGIGNTVTNQAVTENSIFEAASLSKSVFAYFVMKLSEKGIIDLDRPLHFYLPDSKLEIDQRYKDVSARMVLCHISGFPNWRWFDTPPESVEVERGEFFMVSDPNTAFTYSGEAYSYLARVIAHLNFVNMNELGDIFQKEIAKPLGLKHAYFVWDDYLYDNKVYGHKEGKPRKRNEGSGLPNQNSKFFDAAGGLETEAKSYATFLTAIMNNKGLMPDTNVEMLQGYINLPSDNPSFVEQGIKYWGLGFGIKPMGKDLIYRHGGSNSGFQSEFAFSKSKKFGYVFFVNCDKGEAFDQQLEKFLEIN